MVTGQFALPFQKHSDTSRHAAEHAAAAAPTELERVRRYFIGQHLFGSTDEQCQIALKMAGDTQRPRRVSLTAKGFLVDTGKTRTTTKGREATVWKFADAVRDHSQNGSHR